MNKAAQSILIAVGVLLALGGVAQAQTVKKYITPDGKTVYSDSPIPGAREVGEIKAPPRLDSGSSPRTQGAARSEAQQVEALDKRLQQQAAQRDRIGALEDKLEEAKKTLAEGKEPLPGERKGIVGAGTRLTDAYWDRQKANQKAVDNAQRALDDAIAAQKQ
jgi:flagellar motility protein MotE (MotC chaperone)